MNSILAYTGVELASRPYDTLKYPFGRGRYIYLFGFTTSILALGSIAAIGFIEGISTLLNPQIIVNAYGGILFISIALAVDGATLITAYREHSKLLKTKKVSNPLLKALVIENFMDVVSESIAIGALALSFYSAFIDGVASTILSIILAIYAYHLAKENVEVLLEKAAPAPIIARAIKIALSNPAVIDVNSIKSLTIEPGNYLVIMELELDPKLSLSEVDQISKEIRSEIKRYIPSIKYIVLEPRMTDGIRDSHKVLLKAIAKLKE